jgi:hypothetical protein
MCEGPPQVWTGRPITRIAEILTMPEPPSPAPESWGCSCYWTLDEHEFKPEHRGGLEYQEPSELALRVAAMPTVEQRISDVHEGIKDPRIEPHGESADPVARLEAEGVDPAKARRLVADHPGRIELQRDCLEDRKPRDRAACLIDSI